MLGTQSCLTLCNPTNCSLPASSVCGILQAGLLEWIAFPCSRGSSWPRDQTRVSFIAGGLFTIWANREANTYDVFNLKVNNNQTKYGKWKAAIAVLGLFSLSKNVYLLATEIKKMVTGMIWSLILICRISPQRHSPLFLHLYYWLFAICGTLFCNLGM